MEAEWVFPVCSLPLRNIQTIRKTKTCLSRSTEHGSRLSICMICIKPKNAKQKVKYDQKNAQVYNFSQIFVIYIISTDITNRALYLYLHVFKTGFQLFQAGLEPAKQLRVFEPHLPSAEIKGEYYCSCARDAARQAV